MSQLSVDIQCAGSADFNLNVQCDISAKGVTAVYGPSGSGKTTLLDCVAGLRRPSNSSSIRFGDQAWHCNGKTMPAWQRRVGYVFNDARLFPHLSVKDNLNYGARRNGHSKKLNAGTVSDWMGISKLLDRQPERLSAGEKQRVAIARALLSEPQLLLLDEPFANLDTAARSECLHHLQKITEEIELPMLFVSHNIEEVSQLADYLVLLEQGQIKQHGPLLELCNRLDTSLSREETAAAIVTAQVDSHDPDYGLTHLKLEKEVLIVSQMANNVGTPQRIRIPARDVSICRNQPSDTSILNVFPVTIDAIENTGPAHCLLRLQLGSQFLLARITLKSAHTLELKVGENVYAQIKSAALLTAPLENS